MLLKCINIYSWLFLPKYKIVLNVINVVFIRIKYVSDFL